MSEEFTERKQAEMVTDADRGAFVRRFAAVWRSPEPETFAELWADTGTLSHPTMAAPIPHSAIPAYVERIKALVPDISLRVLNWAPIDSGVLIEWEITGTFRDEQLAWRGADRFTLRGDRAVEGVAYFDTHALWARIDPSMDRGPLEAALSMSKDGAR